MHNVSANYTLPTVLSSLKPPQIEGVVKARAATSAGGTAAAGSSGASGATSGSGLQTTFLDLLSKELQNQDPTAPVDSTAMVGQMISLNQLDQLISINQTLSTSSAATPAGTSGSAQPAVAKPANADPLSPATTTPTPNTLPFDPNTMMPLSSSNSSALAASFNSSLNPATLGFSSTGNSTNTNTQGER